MSAKHYSQANGMVKKTTLILAAAVAFCIGLYGGHLATTLSLSSAETETRQVLGGQGAANPENDPELQRLQQAVRQTPQSADAWSSLGHWYFDHSMPGEAVKAYESSLIIRPNDANVITDLGVMYRELHEHDKALELFRKAANIDPAHLQSRFNQGVVLFYDFERRDEGMAIWSELVKRDANYRMPDGQKLGEFIEEYKKTQR